MSARLAKKTKSSRAKKSGPPIVDDSPITVGGGGGSDDGTRRKGLVPVFVSFRHFEDYPTTVTGSNKKKLFQRTVPVRRLLVAINHIVYDLSPWIPADAKGCTLKIKCKGSNEHIDMYIEHAGIKFHTGKYPPEMGNQHQSPDRTNYINKVKFTTPMQPYEFKWEHLTAADEVGVLIDTN